MVDVFDWHFRHWLVDGLNRWLVLTAIFPGNVLICGCVIALAVLNHVAGPVVEVRRLVMSVTMRSEISILKKNFRYSFPCLIQFSITFCVGSTRIKTSI